MLTILLQINYAQNIQKLCNIKLFKYQLRIGENKTPLEAEDLQVYKVDPQVKTYMELSSLIIYLNILQF